VAQRLSPSEVVARLKQAVMNGDPDEVLRLSRLALELGVDPLEAIERGLVAGVLEVGNMWVRGEAFIADLVAAADAMKAGLSVLKEEVVKRGAKIEYRGRVVIGTVEGDIHDIGKSLVATMLEAAGFEVIDLGVDVPAEKFVEAIEKYEPDVVALSALMTTTMLKQREVIKAIEKAGYRSRVKVVVGGAPTSEEWAREIGADGWAPDAVSAVELLKKLLGSREEAGGGSGEA